MDAAEMAETQQQAEWRARLLVDLMGRRFDDATLVAMLRAGLDEAHSEGLRDAAEICQKVADADPKRWGPVASVLARQIRALIKMNRDAHRQEAP